MWHRKGGLLILVAQSNLRVDEQDWNHLVLEAHLPTCAVYQGTDIRQGPTTITRTLFERESGARTEISMMMNPEIVRGALRMRVNLHIGEAEDGVSRAWTLRLHLPNVAFVVDVDVDKSTEAAEFSMLEPIARASSEHFCPFGGKGARPAPLAGRVAEVELRSSREARIAEITLEYGRM